MNIQSLQQWLMTGETLIAHIEDDGFFSKRVLVLTSLRAILLQCTLFECKELSDKYWHQLACVSLSKGLFNTVLRLRFIKHHIISDQADEPLATPWILSGLSRQQAENVYRLLKEKERESQTWRFAQCKEMKSTSIHIGKE
jgi:hypothetical protein